MTEFATTTEVVRDPNLDIDRKVVKGTQIPPDLLEAYQALGETEEPESSTNPAIRGLSADVVIAGSTLVVHDDVLDIDRKIVKGTAVPPDLLAAYAAATGDKSADPGNAPEPVKVADIDDYDEVNAKDLVDLITADNAAEIKAYEVDHKDRSTVIAACDTALQSADPGNAPE